MNENKIPIFQVDAFTNESFKGNYAGVCPLSDILTDNQMQAIAAEMNLPETAFITQRDSENFQFGQNFNLRWFTPKNEIKMCGHATLASGHILFSHYKNIHHVIYFHTLSGILSVIQDNQKLSMDFPQNSPTEVNYSQLLSEIFGISSKMVINVSFDAMLGYLLVEIKNSDDLPIIKPDFNKMMELKEPEGITGIILTAEAGGKSQIYPKYDFISRFFTPWYGINEDPVTGSSHTVLGPFWKTKLNKAQLKAFQCSQRGGSLELEVLDNDRIKINGYAVTVMEGTLYL